MAKTEVLFTRVSIDFAARVKAHAAARGYDTTAEYIRRLIEADLDGGDLAAVKAEVAEMRASLAEMRARLIAGVLSQPE